MSKTILISGASSGIGREIANTLHNEGNIVIGLSRINQSAGFPSFFFQSLCKLADQRWPFHLAVTTYLMTE